MEIMENEVPELAVWRSNLVAVATYFHTSKCRTKGLAPAGNDIVVAFPDHDEVRFAKHLYNLIAAVLSNLVACRAVFTATVDNPDS